MQRTDCERRRSAPTVAETLSQVDFVPPTLPLSHGKAKLIAMEDNEPVIKMTVKGRSPNMRHVPRTHRIDLDWLYERIREDPGVSIKYVPTRYQIGDLLTKGSFTTELWRFLCDLANLVPALPVE